MDKEKNLREELLKQMEKNHGGAGAPSLDPASAKAIVAKEAGRIRRMERFAMTSWIVLAAAFIIATITGALVGFKNETWLVSSILGIEAILITSVACTISLRYMRRSLKMDQMHATLSEIQEQLKKISLDK